MHNKREPLKLNASQARVIADLCAWLRRTAEESYRDEALRHGGLMSDDIAREIEKAYGLEVGGGSVEIMISTDPIPPVDLERARHYVRERGWVGKGVHR